MDAFRKSTEKVANKSAEVKELFRFLFDNEKSMSLNQIDLVKSMKRQFNRNNTITDRQKAVLIEIKTNIHNDKFANHDT
jgi:hypothetical protein